MHAYFYDAMNRTEAFCSVSYGEGQECVLKVEKRAAFGACLSDMLSMDFVKAMDHLEPSGRDYRLIDQDWDVFAEDAACLEAWGGTKNDVARLYLISKYADMCADHRELYSLGQFEKLLGVIYDKPWGLKPLGFFVPEAGSDEGTLYRCGKAGYVGAHGLGTANLDDLGKRFEDEMLGAARNTPAGQPALEVFEISDVAGAALLSLFHLIRERIMIRRCANCRKFFVPLVRSDAIYCDRVSPEDGTKTCKEYGSKVLWYKNILDDEVAKFARNIYCAKQMLAKRNPDKPEYVEMFEYFKTEKKARERAVKAGEQTREEFMDWLRKMSRAKTREELGSP